MSTLWMSLRLFALGTFAAVLAACAPSAYLVRQPIPSGLKTAAPPPAVSTLTVVDQRRAAERDFSTGRLPATLRTEAGPIDAPAFLAMHLQAELASRGLPVQVLGTGSAPPMLQLHTFRVLNHRATGFSPFVTLTFLAADIDTPSGKKRVAAFVRRAKVPVWSFDEVIDPTFNQPLSLAIKDLATKIAARLWGYRASDADVDALVARLAGSKRTGDSFLDVYALGFTNNPRAIDHVTQLSKDADEYVRLAAISSLGTLRVTDKHELLKSIYESSDAAWHDRAMAIKAIGDLDTPESRAYLEAQLKRWEAASGNEALWTAQVIRLYL